MFADNQCPGVQTYFLVLSLLKELMNYVVSAVMVSVNIQMNQVVMGHEFIRFTSLHHLTRVRILLSDELFTAQHALLIDSAVYIILYTFYITIHNALSHSKL